MNTVMPLNFEPREKSAVDEKSGISILRPRMLPDARPDGSAGIEYQYAFRRDGETVGAMGLFGTETTIRANGGSERQYTLDLSPVWVLEDMLKFKQSLSNSDEPFSFIQSLAQGLVNSFVGQTGNLENLRYVAFTHADSLMRVAVQVPQSAQILDDGRVILANALVHAHQA
ncbi:hypothetical protein I5U41_13195 [Stenotrophomonas maltophilia]|nr:hypothetical protein [Stenotrophomonas maltophilia]